MAIYVDADVLLELIMESVDYYLNFPIFLRRNTYELDDVIDIISTDDLFVVWDNDTPIGAYIKPEYRGMGIGNCLLNEVINHCVEKNPVIRTVNKGTNIT